MTVTIEHNEGGSGTGVDAPASGSDTAEDSVSDQDLTHGECGSLTKVGATVTFPSDSAEFHDNDPLGTASDYTASTAWGDGTSSSGTVTKDESDWQIADSHTYTTSGTYAPKITVTDVGGSTVSMTCPSFTISVAAAAAAATTPTAAPGLPHVGLSNGSQSPSTPLPLAALLLIPAVAAAWFVVRNRFSQ